MSAIALRGAGASHQRRSLRDHERRRGPVFKISPGEKLTTLHSFVARRLCATFPAGGARRRTTAAAGRALITAANRSSVSRRLRARGDWPMSALKVLAASFLSVAIARFKIPNDLVNVSNGQRLSFCVWGIGQGVPAVTSRMQRSSPFLSVRRVPFSGLSRKDIRISALEEIRVHPPPVDRQFAAESASHFLERLRAAFKTIVRQTVTFSPVGPIS
jgi:hypothetical protein